MKTKKLILIGAIWFGALVPASSALAQGYSLVLNKLEQLETRVAEIDQHNKSEVGAIKRQLKTGTGVSDVEALRAEIASLRSEMSAQQTAEPDPEVTALVGELGGLVAQLRDDTAERRKNTGDQTAVVAPKPVNTVGKVSGYMFGDYYAIASASGRSLGAVSGAKESANNGFAFRRIYLEYNRKLDVRFSTRLRLEAKDAGYGKGDKMEPFVKHAYLKYAEGSHQVYVGLVGTPTWSISEKHWGYRSIEKTAMDLHKIGSSADLGVAYKGSLGGPVKVYAMIGNGPGQKPEQDNGKKAYLQLSTDVGSVQLAGYGDWEDLPGGDTRATMAAYIGFKGKRFNSGIEAFARNSSGADSRGASLFARVRTSATMGLFGRVDIFDPDKETDADGEYLLLAGFDWTPFKDVHVMPNMWMQSYQQSGVDADVVPRLTFYYKF